MKEVELKNIPISSFFWRKNGSRWYLADCCNLGCITDDEPPRIVEIANEVVLSDPMLCSNCWEPLDWPPTNKCSHCGHKDINQESLETIKAFITFWCGAENPHI